MQKLFINHPQETLGKLEAKTVNYFLCAAEPRGRFRNDSILWGECAVKYLSEGFVPTLDHSGEQAAHFLKTRPVSSSTYRCEDVAKRLTHALSEFEWLEMLEKIEVSSLVLVAAGCKKVAINLSLNRLFASALSPRKASDVSKQYTVQIIENLVKNFAAVNVFLTWEEQIPFGLSPSDGIALIDMLNKIGVQQIFVKTEYLFSHPIIDVEIANHYWLQNLVGTDVFFMSDRLEAVLKVQERSMTALLIVDANL